MRTQISLLRRLAVVVIGVLAAAAMLLTFPSARAAGASILASAGVISIVAGLAAQTSLANVFAGLQLAFTDAIRVDDVVVVEEEWGRIEEITLTYVVVHIWDDRRMVLPSTYFTTTPFENWTRTQSAVLGSVEIDVDWSVPFEVMRGELARLLEGHELWDERVGILQVTDAVGSVVRVRALVSAKDGPTLFDLRCHVREGLVVWLQREHGYGLPRVRLDSSPAVTPSAPATQPSAATTTPPCSPGAARPGRPAIAAAVEEPAAPERAGSRSAAAAGAGRACAARRGWLGCPRAKHRRRRRAGDPGLARKPHRGGRGRPRRRDDRPGRRAQRRLHRRLRGRGAAGRR